MNYLKISILIFIFSCTDRKFKDEIIAIDYFDTHTEITVSKNYEVEKLLLECDDRLITLYNTKQGNSFNLFSIKEDNYKISILKGSDTLFQSVQYIYDTSFEGFIVDFPDVKQGDCIVIRPPNGSATIIDGGYGTSSEGMGEWTGAGVPYLLNYLYDAEINNIKNAIITHDDSDHKGGIIDLINSNDFTVENIFLPGESQLYTGDSIKIDDDLFGKIINPFPEKSDDNNNSVVMVLKYDEIDFLFTGDLENEGEMNLIDKNLLYDIEVLKVAHHGSRYSSTNEFLNITKPEFSIIMSGEGNPYNHPSEDTLVRLKNSSIYRTDKFGSIRIITDGKNLQTINF
ncbi:MAG: MBL fold metallo-hydrolase [Candidatus Delongbacteria bacterium]|nr:MBL fold metallo-hydrolase [Candidatus Delongbacteria bacterium]MBN2833731.1 MBL fold metallo-hydrolase [Candidatus Delongbacteria bacterium]